MWPGYNIWTIYHPCHYVPFFWRTTLQLVFTVHTWICYIRIFNFIILISLVNVTVVSNMYVVLSIYGAYIELMRVGVYWGCYCCCCIEGGLGCVSSACTRAERYSCYLYKYWYNRFISNLWLWQSVRYPLIRWFLLQVQKIFPVCQNTFPFRLFYYFHCVIPRLH